MKALFKIPTFPNRLLSPETKLTEREWETIFEKSQVLSDLMDNYKDGSNVVRNVDNSPRYSLFKNDASEDEYSDEISPRRSNPMVPFGPPPINPYDYDTAQPRGFRDWLKKVLTSSEEWTGRSSSSSSSEEEFFGSSSRDLFDQEKAIGSYF